MIILEEKDLSTLRHIIIKFIKRQLDVVNYHKRIAKAEALKYNSATLFSDIHNRAAKDAERQIAEARRLFTNFFPGQDLTEAYLPGEELSEWA